MAYTFTEHIADGRMLTFPFHFSGSDKGYITPAEILVEEFFYDEEKDEDVWEPVKGWLLTGTNQITFQIAPIAGTQLRIRRVANKDRPYAEFDRGVALDMKSLNNSFVHLLEITQELLDGFWPEGYFVKQHLNMGGFQIKNMMAGTDPHDAVTKQQLDGVDFRHEQWNLEQDMKLAGLEAAMTSNIAHTTIPWFQKAKEGQTLFQPPYKFTDALVFINGVFQHQLADAFIIRDNSIVFHEGLHEGDELYALIGSRPAAFNPDAVYEFTQDVTEGTRFVDIGRGFKNISVTLDGLTQNSSNFKVVGTQVHFDEALPACTFLAYYTPEKS